MEVGGRPRTYSPLPWIDEFTNLVYLETGARKTVVLAVGEDSRTGAWTFVLNHRKDYGTTGTVTAMDWTNQCPMPSELPFELLMIDMNSGAILEKFKYLWTFQLADFEIPRLIVASPCERPRGTRISGRDLCELEGQSGLLDSGRTLMFGVIASMS
jgi:hypothetical protein